MYTTGEVARICGITVRTVQFYDTKGLVTPSGSTEGGRRLYSSQDLSRMKIVCFLREAGIPVRTVAAILREDNSREVITLLLQEQKWQLEQEISGHQNKVQLLDCLIHCLTEGSVHANGMMEEEIIHKVEEEVHNMEEKQDKKALWNIRRNLLLVGIPLNILEIAAILYGINSGSWWPLALVLVTMIPLGVVVSRYYLKSVNYRCPQCNAVFKANPKEAFWASHTPNTRKLTCPQCGTKGFCVETTRLPQS